MTSACRLRRPARPSTGPRHPLRRRRPGRPRAAGACDGGAAGAERRRSGTRGECPRTPARRRAFQSPTVRVLPAVSAPDRRWWLIVRRWSDAEVDGPAVTPGNAPRHRTVRGDPRGERQPNRAGDAVRAPARSGSTASFGHRHSVRVFGAGAPPRREPGECMARLPAGPVASRLRPWTTRSRWSAERAMPPTRVTGRPIALLRRAVRLPVRSSRRPHTRPGSRCRSCSL